MREFKPIEMKTQQNWHKNELHALARDTFTSRTITRKNEQVIIGGGFKASSQYRKNTRFASKDSALPISLNERNSVISQKDHFSKMNETLRSVEISRQNPSMLNPSSYLNHQSKEKKSWGAGFIQENQRIKRSANIEASLKVPSFKIQSFKHNTD